MLTAQQKIEAEKRLKMMSSEMAGELIIKDTIKKNVKTLTDLLTTLKNDPKAQKTIIASINSKIANQVLSLEFITKQFQEVEQRMKADKERAGKDALFAIQDKNKYQMSIEEIKQTIKKIQDTVKESIEEQSKKRKKIEDDLEVSLGQIRSKIETFTKQSAQMTQQNEVLRTRQNQIKIKMQSLEQDFKTKAQQKDDQVRKEKQQLMERLKQLQGEVSEVTQINKEYSGIEKQNFDKKLSLYLKTKKFPEYSTSFQNSARTIDQCKEQLLKGVQRLNDAKQMIQKCEKDSNQFSNMFLGELKKKTQKQQKIQGIKKEKQAVRDRIIQLQNKIKEKKSVSS